MARVNTSGHIIVTVQGFYSREILTTEHMEKTF